MLKTQLYRFIIIGLFGTGVDWLVYTMTMDVLGISVAKALSFICGSVIAFVFNKIWTFEDRNSAKIQIVKFITLYVITLGINILINAAILLLLPEKYLIAFIFATGVHTVVNFLGQKLWVFKLQLERK